MKTFVLLLSTIVNLTLVAQSGSSSILKVESNTSVLLTIASILEYSEQNYNSDPELVISHLQAGVKLCEQKQDTFSLIKLLQFNGVAQQNIGLGQEAIKSLEMAKSLSIASNDSLNLSLSFAHLGFYHDAKGEVSFSEKNYAESLRIAKIIKNPKNTRFVKSNIATMFARQGDFKRAISIFDQLIKFCEKHNIESTRVQLNKAQTLSKIGEYSEALDIFYGIRELAETKSNSLLIAQIDHNIGFILKRSRLFSEAAKKYESVLKYFKQKSDIFHLQSVLESLGEIMFETGRVDTAEQYLLEALDLAKENKTNRLGSIIENLGRVKLVQKDLEKAQLYFETAIAKYEEVKDYPRKSFCFNYLSELKFHQEQYEESLAYAIQAKDNSIEYMQSSELATAYNSISKNFHKLGFLKDAINTKEQADSVNRDLNDPEKLFLLSQKIVKQRYLEKTNPKENKNYLSAWLFIGLILIAIILLFSLKHDKPKISPSFSIKDSQDLLKRVEKVIEEKEPFLNENLSLNELASLLDTTDKKLSTFLNQHLKTNFYDYINKLRIKKFIELVNQDQSKRFSITGLAYESGFKSKSSFYRAFKKETNLTPSQYLKNNN